MALRDFFLFCADGRAGAISPQPLASQPKPGGKLAALIGTGAAGLLIATVGAWEGKRNDPYRDIVGVWTVCYGETNVSMRRYSDAECKAMLSDSLADYAGPVLARNPELRGHDAQTVAATSLAYNIGVSAYRRSTVAKRFSAGNWRGACDAFLSWSYAGGKQVNFLTQPQPLLEFRYEGLNLAENNAPVIIELYKLATDPLQELALITGGNALAGVQIACAVQIDGAKSATGPLGQFGRFIQVTMPA